MEIKNKIVQTAENYYNPNTTDKQNELLWRVDKDDNEIGSVTRAECHNSQHPVWHRTTHAYLFDTDGNLMLTRRSEKKDTAPGLWTVSAAGHVPYGQTYLQTITREIEEELGLQIEVEHLDTFPVDYGFEQEVVGVFAGIIEKRDITKNHEEVSEIRLVPLEQFSQDFQSGKAELSGGSRDSFAHLLETGTLKAYWQKHFG